MPSDGSGGSPEPERVDRDPWAWPARTPRLTIRPATAGDLDATWAYRSIPEVDEWQRVAVTDHAGYGHVFVSRLASTLVIEHRSTVVGDLMLRVEDAWSQTEVADRAHLVQAEVGWVVAPDHAGRGYATEATTELLRICFEDLGLRRVTAFCFAENVASWRMMERIGMRRETHTRRDSLHRTRGWLDGYGYAILAEEWRAGPRHPGSPGTA